VVARDADRTADAGLFRAAPIGTYR
jgi:hypothetical protein